MSEHVVIKNNGQKRPVTGPAAPGGKIVSGKPHLAKHAVGKLNQNKPHGLSPKAGY